MPTATFMVTVEVKIGETGANVNEILRAVDRVRSEIGVQLSQAIIQWEQEWVRDRLCSGDGAAKKGLGAHPMKTDESRGCRCRTFIKEGYRSESRQLRTELGDLEFEVGYVSCQGCGKKWSPILSTLGLRPYQGHAGEFERVVVEAANKTSFARGAADLEGLTGVPTSKSSAHRWVADLKLPSGKPRPLEVLMADGTGYKKRGGESGELRVAIGVTKKGRLVGLGSWSGQTWAQIGREVRQKWKRRPRAKLCVVDGEAGLENPLASLAERTQRSRWHLVRDLRSRLWHDDLKKADTDPWQEELTDLLAIEIPSGEWEKILPLEKAKLRDRVDEARKRFQEMIDEFEHRGYTHGAEYLKGAQKGIFSRIQLWLETGIIAPSSTGLLEEIMREIGRRVKKLGWNWNDHGVTQQAKMILLRRYSQEEWDAYWKRRLDLQGRCQATVTQFERVA